jgi:hypothetical protein
VSHTPGLVQIHDEFSDSDVMFLGLTDEGADAIDEIESFADRLSVPWPIGYGATSTTNALKVPGYPTTFVIGRDGKVAWNSFMAGSLKGEIDKAL